MRLVWIALVGAMFAAGITAQEKPQSTTTVRLLDDAVADGRLTPSKAVIYKHQFLSGGALPAYLQGNQAVKCGLPLMADVEHYTREHPEAGLVLFPRALQSTYQHVFSTSRGLREFRIHYSNTGQDAVPSTDANGNGIPDWVEQTGVYLEQAYRLQVDTLGYLEPARFDAGGGFMDIYVADYNYYGGTSWPLGSPPEDSCYIEIDNDFTESIFATHGYDALRVTCAHEFFHAIQITYAWRGTDPWYYELSSTWMEDVAHDDVNDYYQYLPSFFNSPSRSLFYTGGYEAAHWNLLVEKRIGRDAILQSWQNMTAQLELTAIDNAIRSSSGSDYTLPSIMQQFALWNYFTGLRSDSIEFYPEGSGYPAVRLSINRPLSDTSLTTSLDPLSARYYSSYVIDSTNLDVSFNSSSGGIGTYAIEYNRETGRRFFTYRPGTSSFVMDLLAPGDSVVIVVINSSMSESASYSLALNALDSAAAAPISDFVVYPSPFDLTPEPPQEFVPLRVKFKLRDATAIEFDIFSSSGKHVLKRRISNVQVGNYNGGTDFSWDGRTTAGERVASGVYIYRFKGRSFTRTGKIAIIR
jgi:hypothetical protein